MIADMIQFALYYRPTDFHFAVIHDTYAVADHKGYHVYGITDAMGYIHVRYRNAATYILLSEHMPLLIL